MNTPDYLRQAMNDLQQALTSTKTDIDELTRMIANRDKETKDRLSELKRREALRVAEAAAIDNGPLTVAALNSARMARNEESQVQNDFNRMKKELDSQLALKQRSMDDINSMIRQLDQIAAQSSQSTILA